LHRLVERVPASAEDDSMRASFTKSWVIASPMPLVPPLMTATLSANLDMVVPSVCVAGWSGLRDELGRDGPVGQSAKFVIGGAFFDRLLPDDLLAVRRNGIVLTYKRITRCNRCRACAPPQGRASSGASWGKWM
jgi:hypothetical protein